LNALRFQQDRPGNGQKTGHSGRNSWKTLSGRAIITSEWDLSRPIARIYMIFKIYEQVWIKILAENKEMASTFVLPGYHRVSGEGSVMPVT